MGRDNKKVPVASLTSTLNAQSKTAAGCTTVFTLFLTMIVLPPLQIISHSKNLGESKPFQSLTKIIEKNTKIYAVK